MSFIFPHIVFCNPPFTNGEVKIAGVMYNFNATAFVPRQVPYYEYGYCDYEDKKIQEEIFSGDPTKKVRGKFVFDGNTGWRVLLKGKAITFKHNGSRFKRYATKMQIKLEGNAYEHHVQDLCAFKESYSIPYNSYKRRYRTKAKKKLSTTYLKVRGSDNTVTMVINGETKTLLNN